MLTVIRSLALLLIAALSIEAQSAAKTPPDEVVRQLYHEAAVVVHVADAKHTAVRQDGIYKVYRVKGHSVRAYNGNPGRMVEYSVLVETGLESFTSERIAFLRHARQGSYRERVAVPWVALETGDFKFDCALERQIARIAGMQPTASPACSAQ